MPASGEPNRTAAADGGFASHANLSDIAFHKKCGLRIADMVRSHWVYRKLRNFGAGIEAGISCLTRAYGVACCSWRGLEHFKAYVWSSVVAYNLALLTRGSLMPPGRPSTGGPAEAGEPDFAGNARRLSF